MSNLNTYMGRLNIMMAIHATDWLFTYDSLSYSSRRTTTVWQQSHIQENVYVNNESCSLFFQNLFKSHIYNEIVCVDTFVFIVWLHALQHVTFHSCPFIRIFGCESWVIHSMLSVYLGLLHAIHSEHVIWNCGHQQNML